MTLEMEEKGMGRAQDLFDEACVYYDKAQKLVKTVGDTYRKLEKEVAGETTFNPRITIAEFDQILQGILLTQALADNDFHRLERQFIDKITDHGDLLKFIEHDSKGKLSLTWDDIAWMDSETQGRLIEILPDILKRRCIDFLQPFVVVVDEVDLMETLVGYIGEIGARLAYVDGQVDDIEGTGAYVMIKALLLEPWQAMRKMYY